MLTGVQAQSIYDNLRPDFQKGVEYTELIGKDLYETVPSGGESNLYGWLSHVPGFRRWYTGQPRAIRNIEEKSYRVPNLRYEDSFSISEDKYNDNQLVQFSKATEMLGKAGKILEDQIVFKLFNYGFALVDGNNESVAGYDDKAWFADDHTVGVSTIDNKSTLVLNEDNYGSVLQRLMSFTAKPDKMSEIQPLNAMVGKPILVVPPALLGTAISIVKVQLSTGGISQKWYDTADILVSSYLTSSTAWYLVNVNGPAKPIFFQDREGLRMEEKTPGNDSDAFMYDEIIVGAKRRCNALVTFPWLAIGSTGAATSE